MKAILEDGPRDGIHPDHILPQRSRPQPADIQILFQEYIDRISRAGLDLIGSIHAIPTGYHEVAFIAGHQDFLRMLKLEPDARKKAGKRRLIADPDRVVRHRAGHPDNQRWADTADLLDVACQLVRRLHSIQRRVSRHDDRNPAGPLLRQNHRPGLCHSAEPGHRQNYENRPDYRSHRLSWIHANSFSTVGFSRDLRRSSGADAFWFFAVFSGC